MKKNEKKETVLEPNLENQENFEALNSKKESLKEEMIQKINVEIEKSLALFKEEIEKKIAEVHKTVDDVILSAVDEADKIKEKAKDKCNDLKNTAEALIEKKISDIEIKEAILSEREAQLDKNDLYKKINSLLLESKKEYASLQSSIKNLSKEKESILKEAREAAERIVETSTNDYETYVSQIKELAKKQEDTFKSCIQRERDDFNLKQTEELEKLDIKSKELSLKEKQLNDKELEILKATENVKSLEQYRSLLKSLQDDYEKQKKIYEELIAQNEKLRISQTAEQKEKIRKEVLEWEDQEREIFKKELNELQEANKRLREQNAQLEVREAKLAELEASLDSQIKTYNIKLENLNHKEENLKNTISELTKDVINGKNEEITNLKNTLQQTINEKNEVNEKFLRANLILRDKNISASSIDEKEVQIKKLKKELEDKAKEFDNKDIEIKAKADAYDVLLAKHIELQKEYAKIDLKNKEYISTKDQAERSEAETQLWKKQFLDLAEELNRRKDPTKDQRIAPLTRSVPDIKEFDSLDACELTDEIKWLETIKKDSDSSGIYFSNRIINAYHTSMKIHDWSPLTVLAGVSGTGKSELPRQYANHGGMYFVSIAVKPDWDSPSSLFGFYNSIENKFQPTELLKVLYNAQTDKNFKLSDKMVMVLLDEMNLAHVELYFADLLSKFEYIRGTKDTVKYEIDLGAGCDPEILSLGNNILWTGTMNEDETTKALSDKVIDRSTLISFPRPKTLFDRKNTENVPSRFYISQDLWQQWIKSALTIDQINSKDKDLLQNYKEVVQSINDQMSKMGRNLGHRVWQSITNYMLNHPKVIKAYNDKKIDLLKTELQNTFSEAVAFKIMPKLRGVETKGSYEEFINNIKVIIDKNIPELTVDFENATRLPSGLFQWCSAEFLEEKVVK